MNRRTKKHLLTLLLCVCFVAGYLLASIFILEHADHDCVGHDCDVCTQIHSIGKVLKQLSMLVACLVFALAGLTTFFSTCRFIIRNILFLTPVTLKIRMNN